MTDTTAQVPFLKRDAIVTLEIGAQFYSNMQEALSFLAKDLTDADKKAFQTKVENKQPLEGPELALFVLTALSIGVMNKARDTNQVDYKDLQTTLGL